MGSENGTVDVKVFAKISSGKINHLSVGIVKDSKSKLEFKIEDGGSLTIKAITRDEVKVFFSLITLIQDIVRRIEIYPPDSVYLIR